MYLQDKFKVELLYAGCLIVGLAGDCIDEYILDNVVSIERKDKVRIAYELTLSDGLGAKLSIITGGRAELYGPLIYLVHSSAGAYMRNILDQIGLPVVQGRPVS